MKIRKDTSLREVAFIVCNSLDRIGAAAVLTGGSAAVIWAPKAVQSLDCDFVLVFSQPSSLPQDVLTRLGYQEEGGIYIHSANPVTLEFPPEPLCIGREEITQWATLREKGRRLHVLTPTDSCRDRLAGFYHWADYKSLAQALAVARAQKVDLDIIRKWSEGENAGERFQEFEERLNRKTQR